MSSETIKVAEVRSWLHRNPRGYVYTQITPIIGSDNHILAVINNKYLLSTLDELPGDRDIVAKKLSSFELLVGI